MDELIKITEQDGRQAVSARELYKFLEIETPFTMWAERMFEYGFSEGADYVSLSQKSDKPQGGRPSAQEMGLFELKKTTINKPDGSVLVSTTTVVTGRGQIYFLNKFIKTA